MVAHLDRISRRSFGALTLGAAAAATTFRAGFAQEASPMATPETQVGLLEGLELTTLNVTATEFTYSVSTPGGLGEGWYVVNLINESETNATANLALMPEGTTAGDLSALAAQSFQGEGGQLPDWWTEATFGGGTFAAPGATSAVAVYLTPGQWSVFTSNPASSQSPANFQILTPEELEANYGVAIEATPAAGATPDAMPALEGVEPSMSLAVSDSGFTPSGMPTSGAQVIEVVNEGEQVHDVVILHTDETLDEASAGSLAQSYVRGEDVNAMIVGGVGTLDPGLMAYAEVDGQAGTHVVFSTLPDADGGLQLETVGVLVFEA